MFTVGWQVLFLVAVVGALPDPSSSSSRNRRQTDTSNLSDAQFLCQLTAADTGVPANCDEFSLPPQPPQNPPSIPSFNPEAEHLGDCICAPAWQCLDNHHHPPEKHVVDPENILIQVNVRSGSPCATPEEICCHNIDTTLGPQSVPFSPSCGKRNTQGLVTSFSGFQNRQSQFGEFPWMAAVMTSNEHGRNGIPIYICGGSLIHDQVVLTAAHYVHDKTPRELAVRLGEWNFKEPSEPMPHQEFGIQEVLVHPRFVKTTLAYDVALLILDQHAKLSHNVDTICLPPAHYDFKDHICVVSGWGKDIFSSKGKFQQILKSIELPPVDHASCELAMRGTRLGRHFHLHESFMCAGGEEGKDACEGDGGSPLACHKRGDPTKYYQAGVVAWGIGCGQAGIPGVYADVTKAVPWINDMIASRFGHDLRSAGK